MTPTRPAERARAALPVAVLAVSGPVERIGDRHLAELGRLVSHAADELSRALGGGRWGQGMRTEPEARNKGA